MIVYFAQWGCSRAVLIVLYPRYSRALYLDPSKNIQKKDYTHIKYVLDRAMLGFSMRGGYIQCKKIRPGFVSATRLTSVASSNRQEVRMMDSTSSI